MSRDASGVRSAGLSTSGVFAVGIVPDLSLTACGGGAAEHTGCVVGSTPMPKKGPREG